MRRSQPTRFELYEACTQNPPLVVALLRAIHGGPDPRLLREDFCGSAAVSAAWARSDKNALAVAVDIDPEPLRAALARKTARVRVIRGDALNMSNAGTRGRRADVIFVGNFSIGEIHDRTRLVRYFQRSLARLAEHGVFVCDTYGGETAYVRGSVQRVHDLPGRGNRRVRYTWEQRDADPLTGMVTNAIHFRVVRNGKVVSEFTDAFVYRWRLWSIAELREAMHEAGFRQTRVYSQLPDAQDSEGRYYAPPINSPRELGASYIVCIAGRRESHP